MSTLQYTSVEEIPRIVEDLRTSFNQGLTRDLHYRQKQLRSLAYLIEENREAFKNAFLEDMGRAEFETYVGDLNSTLSDVVDLQKNLFKFAKPHHASGGLAWGSSKPHFKREARGVCCIIGPWNYPIQCLIVPMAGAIASGNTVLIKPSEVVPTIAALITKLLPQYLDTRCYKIVNGGAEEAGVLLKQRFDYIFYTGGSAVAKIISHAAAEHLTPVGLELGGQCPAIVDESANIEIAAKRIAWAKSFNSGQTCVAPNHVLVMESVKDKLVAAIKKQWQTAYPEGSKDQGSIVNERHFGRVTKQLDASSGSIVHGNKRTGNHLSVTLVDRVTLSDSLLEDEIFGPVLPIIAIKSIDEAVKITNSMGSPLAIYLFSSNSANQRKVSAGTRSGSVVYNHCVVQLTAPVPFTGVGTSGNTGYRGNGGEKSFEVFSYERSYLDVPNFTEPILSIMYPPYTSGWKYKALNMLNSRNINFAKPGTESGFALVKFFKKKSLWLLLTVFGVLLAMKRS